MQTINGLLVGTQLIFTFIIGMYFYNALKQQQATKATISIDSSEEAEKLRKLREIQLNKPLSEKTRPQNLDDVYGQENGIKALKAALCGPNPQHVIIYGQPGIGKTTAARLVLEEAKKSLKSPFAENAPFVEVDATILQFDERSIADPLIGSVHDPIYQGAGVYGQAGIPQPKQGAVTNAHGGVLFIDEIGELHQMQMNKLLKVLEDGKVTLSSSYYSKENKNIPRHIHDMFCNGLPADFRLVGATTRSPEDLPEALRSRCQEIFFRNLTKTEIEAIAESACTKAEFEYENGVGKLVSQYAANGRDAVNIIQSAASFATLEDRTDIKITDIEEIAEFGRYLKSNDKHVENEQKIGVVNGMAVFGSGSGSVLEIETTAVPALNEGMGSLKITGVVSEEEINSRYGKMRRKSNITNSVENCITLIHKVSGINTKNFDIHINFVGGAPVDGPSAGIAIFSAIYSALIEKAVPQILAMTGEISIKGRVCPVGGVPDKIEAAINAGVKKILIPKSNYQKSFSKYGSAIVCVETVEEVLKEVFGFSSIIIPLNYENNKAYL